MMELLPLHGGQLREIAGWFGIPASELLDFSANINPDGPPAATLSCLRKSLDDPSTLTHYPDLGEIQLKESLAHYAGVRPENIAVANGFMPLLDGAIRALPLETCLVPMPAFVEYRRALERAHMDVIPQPLSDAFSFSYDIHQMLKDSPSAVLLANPQNPSGVLTSREMLVELTREAAARGIYVFLDEAFIDYRPEASLAQEIDHCPNLIVFRSVTKFFGMPGMRIAYALANSKTRERLEENSAPWSVTTLASLAARVAVQDGAYVRRTVAVNNDRRNRLQADIERLGIHVYSSAANFLLLRLPQSVDAQQLWERLIREYHVVLRNCANYEALVHGHLRVGVRSDAENKNLVDFITRVLAMDERDRQTPSLCEAEKTE